MNLWLSYCSYLKWIFYFFQPNFKDYPVYLIKFKQCLSKAMHLIKTYTVNTLQNLTSQLMKRVRWISKWYLELYRNVCCNTIEFSSLFLKFFGGWEVSTVLGENRSVLYHSVCVGWPSCSWIWQRPSDPKDLKTVIIKKSC